MRYFGLSDKGYVRKKNEDHYAIIRNSDDDLLVVVCDGIGGSNAGDVASFEAIKYFSEVFSRSEKFLNVEHAVTYLRHHIKIINDNIFTLATTSKRYSGMGTTITGVLISERVRVAFNIGDSRVYCLDQANNLVQVTIDHNYANELMHSKMISEAELKYHPKRHHITRALGVGGKVIADYYAVDESVKYLLVCSDGLHDYVEHTTIENAVRNSTGSIVTKVNDLLGFALLNGGVDNITIVLIEIQEDNHE